MPDAQAQTAAFTAPDTTPATTVQIDLGGGAISHVQIAGFDAMDTDAQHAAVEDIAAHLRGQQTPAPAAAADTSLTGALGYGLHNAAEGFGKTAELVGSATGWDGLASAGRGLEGATAAPRDYQPTDLAGDLRAGNYKSALTSLPRAAIEGGADLASYLGAGALAGPVGVAAVAASRNLGDNVAARAANNNDATPTSGDWVGGGLTAAGQAALAAVGIGRAPGVGAMLDAAPALARPVVAAGLDAGAAGASDALGQLGASAGTDTGARFDPYETAAAGLQAGAGRLVSAAPELAAVGIRTGTDAAMSAMQPPPASLADAQSIARVSDAYSTAMAAARSTRGDVSNLAVLNGMRTDLVNSAVETAAALRDSGQIDPIQARSLTSLFRDQAARPNSTITQGGDGYATLFDRIDALPIPDGDATTLQNAARDLNTLSTSFANRSGPFQAIGKGVAQAAAIGGAIYSGSPAAIAMAALGIHSVSPIGGAIGAGLDRVLGTTTPTILLRAGAAQRMLAKAGSTAGPSSLSGLQSMTANANAMPPAPGPTVAESAQTMLDRAARGNAVRLAVASAGKMPTPQDGVDDTAVDAAVNNALRRADAITLQAGNVPTPPPSPLPSIGLPPGLPPVQPSAAPGPLPVPPQAPQASPVQPQPTLPPLTPATAPASQAASVGIPATLPFQPDMLAAHSSSPAWQKFVANGAPTLTRGQLFQAVDAAYPDPDQAAIIKGHQGGIDAVHLRPIQAVLGQSPAAGGGGSGAPEGGLGGGVGGSGDAADPLQAVGFPADPSVARPLSYALSAQRNASLADQQAAQARAIGLPTTADALLQVAAAHGQTGTETMAAKQAVMDAHLATLPEAVQASARRLFVKPLLHHGGRTKLHTAK